MSGRVTERRKSQENGCHYRKAFFRVSEGKTGQAGKRESLGELTLKSFTAPHIAVTRRSVNISLALKRVVEYRRFGIVFEL